MARVKFSKKDQIKFLNKVKREAKAKNWLALAEILEVKARSLIDWKMARYTLPEDVFAKCKNILTFEQEIPKYKILPDFWSTKKARVKSWQAMKNKYGGMHPLTLEKAQKAVRLDRKLNPQKYSHRKRISRPPESTELAEFVGIVLGDGRISNNQIGISLHRYNDREYVVFVCSLIKKLFSIETSIYYHERKPQQNEVTITVSRTNLVEYLEEKGLRRGSKVKHQVGVPNWISNDIDLSIATLRGLIDTDGGIYLHRHNVGGHSYLNIGLTFTNGSIPLLNFANRTLSKLGFNPKLSNRRRDIILYRESEVLEYARKVEFHNTHHIKRINNFLGTKFGGVRPTG